jgi:flagellar basal body-associated protein FliL
MKRLNQSGSHIVALLLLVVVLGVVGFAGYTVMHRDKKPSADTTAATTSTDVPSAINSKADLSTTATSLDSDSGSLNSAVDDTSLDSSMNDLL